MKFLPLCGIVLIATSSINGQACCNGGGGSAAVSTPVLLKHDIYVSLMGTHRLIEEQKPVRIELTPNSSSLTAAFGITSKLSVMVRGGLGTNHATYYRDQKIDTIDAEIGLFDTTKGESFAYKSFGLSDGAIGVQYAFLKMLREQKRELKLSGELGIPWGVSKPVHDKNDSTREVDAVRHGSKSWSGGGILSYSRLFVKVPIQLSTSVGGKIRGENFAKTDLGDELIFGLGSAWNPLEKTIFSLYGSYQLEAPAIDSTGKKINFTGGSRIDLQPAFDFLFTKNIRGTVSGKFPIYGDEIQKENGMKYALSIGCAATFSVE